MSVLSVDFKDFEKVERSLRLMSEFQVLPILRFIGEELLTISEEAFQNESDPNTGENWRPSFRAEDEGGQTLTDKVRLRRSLTYQVDRTGNLIYGTNVEYGKDHQDGLDYGGHTGFIKRRFLGFPPGFEESIVNDGAFIRMLRIP